MTDEPLSRRARRAREDNEDLEPGFAAPANSGAVEELGTEALKLSRRDKRRLERVNNPVEVWTAEEEMLATGQIPTLTPEVIAQQERLAREKAAQVQAEAAASAEMRRVSTREASPEQYAEITGQPPVQPAATVEPAQPAVPAQPEPTQPEPAQPEPAQPEPAQPEPAQPSMADPTPSASLQNLFPPGSLQARAFAEQRRQEEADRAAAAASAPQASAPQSVEADDDAAAEIRRLTAAAMASIERTSPVPDDAPQQAVSESAPASDPYGVPALAQAEPEVLPQRMSANDRYEETYGTGATPTLTPSTGGTPAFDPSSGAMPTLTPGTGATPTLTPGTGATPTLTPGTGATPTLTPTTGGVPAFSPGTGATPTLTPGTGATPVLTPGSGGVPTLTPGSGGVPTLTPGGSPAPEPDPNPWASHPLDAAPPAAVNVNDYAPVTDVPRPNFDALTAPGTGSFAPVAGGTPGSFSPYGPGTGATPLVSPGTGATPLVPPTTGATPVVKREPALQPAGGARHFRWAHYAVLGALMFVLGVVVYQVFRLNS